VNFWQKNIGAKAACEMKQLFCTKVYCVARMINLKFGQKRTKTEQELLALMAPLG